MTTGVRWTSWNGPQVIMAVRSVVAKRMETAAGVVETDIKRSMVGGGTPHQPSAPGEPPHVDLGDLRRSLSHSVIADGSGITAYIIANSDHAAPLELGTRTIAPRPFMRPALERNRRRILRIVARGR